MITRRTLLSGIAMVSTLSGVAHAATPERILFVHGRAQGGRNSEHIWTEWMAAFQSGLAAVGESVPKAIDIRLPFYGDTLDDITAGFGLPLVSEIHSRGDAIQNEFLIFQEEAANDIRRAAGVTEAQVIAEYGNNPRERGPLNWQWVQAILAAIDTNAPGLSSAALELFLRDVFLYTSRAGVRQLIDEIVLSQMDARPTVVVGHSLGSVIAYNILAQNHGFNVPLFVTLGSPLGIRAIRQRLRPIRFPRGTTKWFNAYDPRDVVALYPLDVRNFDVVPSVENLNTIRNQTRNRHGISGYLDKPEISSRILAAS